ncbi:MAG: Rieske 2Fe-2S domain-containing protein [Bacteroidia bacterium]|nr:Rieske 2Fe-2S domain-containing protein [Bacteroidia bacterium]
MSSYLWVHTGITAHPGSADHLQEITLKGRRICLIRRDGVWRATDGRCPHAGGPFAAGHISPEGKLICPWHRFAFDLETGASDSGGYCIHVYRVRITQDQLWLRMPADKPWWKFW